MPNALSIDRVRAKCGDAGRSTIYSWIDARSAQHIPEFPKPIKLGRRTVWIEEEIDAYLEAEKRKRNDVRTDR